MMPSQSSSTLLQVSAVGDPAATEHAVPVPEQTTVPERRHAPTPTEHAAPVALHTPEQLVWPVGQPQVPLVQMPPEGELHEVPLVTLVHAVDALAVVGATQVWHVVEGFDCPFV